MKGIGTLRWYQPNKIISKWWQLKYFFKCSSRFFGDDDDDPIRLLRNIFQRGWGVQPPTRYELGHVPSQLSSGHHDLGIFILPPLGVLTYC